LVGSDKLTPRRDETAAARGRRRPRQSAPVWRASQTWRRIRD